MNSGGLIVPILLCYHLLLLLRERCVEVQDVEVCSLVDLVHNQAKQ